MSKNKDVVVDKKENLDMQATDVLVTEIIVDEHDFNELLELEKTVGQTEDQFNKLSGSIKRLEKELDLYYNHEKTLRSQIDLKRKDLVKRYKLDDKRQWKIDINTRKVLYQGQ